MTRAAGPAATRALPVRSRQIARRNVPAPSRVARRRPQTGETVSWLFPLHLVQEPADLVPFFLGRPARRQGLQDEAHRRALVDLLDELAEHAPAGGLAADAGPVDVRLG